MAPATDECCSFQRIGIHASYVIGPYKQCESCDRFLGFQDPDPGTEAYSNRKASLLEPFVPQPLISPASPPIDSSTSSEDNLNIPRLTVSEATPPPASLKRKRDDEPGLASPVPERHASISDPHAGANDIPKSIVWAHAPTQHRPVPRSANRPTWLVPPSPLEPPAPLLPAALASMRLPPSYYSQLPANGTACYQPQRLHGVKSPLSYDIAQFSRNGFDRGRVAASTRASYALMHPNQNIPEAPTPTQRSFALDPQLDFNVNDSPQYAYSAHPTQTQQISPANFVNPQAMSLAPQLQVKYKKHPRPIPSHCTCGVPPRNMMVSGPTPDSSMEVLVCGIGRCGFYIKLALIEQVNSTQKAVHEA